VTARSPRGVFAGDSFQPWLSLSRRAWCMLGKDAWSVSWTSPGGCGISALALVRRSWRTGRHVEGDDREEGWKQDSMRVAVFPDARGRTVGRAILRWGGREHR
jgi:hypothetical protein